jgi:large subunit ribosomal protein L24
MVVGKPAEKFQNESTAVGGWKIHTVKYVDMERNTVFLDGVTVSFCLIMIDLM